MRKIFFGFWMIVLVWSNSSPAQNMISKGTYSLGGNMTYSFNKYEDESRKSAQLTLNPSLYYFVVDRFSVGLDLEYQNAKFPTNSDGRYSPDFKSFAVGPSVRYYLGNEKIYPFVHAGYHYYLYDYPEQKNELSSHAFSFGVGIDYFFVDNIGLEFAVNVDFLKHRFRENRTVNLETMKQDYRLKSRQVAFMIGIVTAF